ncbi:MAG: hypothetical protein HY075_11505 [Deltaproteobacteria bacterium]|nr:hypothetical protein [Deltaproteobacteria bacterium]
MRTPFVLLGALVLGASISAGAQAAYRDLSAKTKQSLIMDEIRSSAYAPGKLPTKGLGFLEATNLVCQRFLSQAFTGDLAQQQGGNLDVLPADRKGVKIVHRYGSVGAVNFHVTNLNHPFTGMFRYDSVGVLRFAPALHSTSRLIPAVSLKLLSDGMDSVNFLALFSLEGQPGDNNYFSNALTTTLAPPGGTVEKVINYFFQSSLKRVPNAPISSLSLPLDEAAMRVKDVADQGNVVVPAVVEFRPTPEIKKLYEEALKTPLKPDEYRERFARLPKGIVAFKMFATAADGKVYEIGEIELTSELIASLYGDEALFFKHQVRAKAARARSP